MTEIPLTPAEQQARKIAERLDATLATVGVSINHQACQRVDAKATEINRISGGLVDTTEEQRAALCELECARMYDEFAEQVESLAQAYIAKIATA